MKALVSIIAIAAIAGFFYWLERGGTCSRVELGYNCKGDNCECRKLKSV